MQLALLLLQPIDRRPRRRRKTRRRPVAKAKEALGYPQRRPSSTHFSKWLDDRRSTLGDDGRDRRWRRAAFVRNISALPRRPWWSAGREAGRWVVRLRKSRCRLEQAKHIEACALTSVGTAANGSPFHPHSLKGCARAQRRRGVAGQPKLHAGRLAALGLAVPGTCPRQG